MEALSLAPQSIINKLRGYGRTLSREFLSSTMNYSISWNLENLWIPWMKCTFSHSTMFIYLGLTNHWMFLHWVGTSMTLGQKKVVSQHSYCTQTWGQLGMIYTWQTLTAMVLILVVLCLIYTLEDQEQLKQLVYPLNNSDNYGIELYERTLLFLNVYKIHATTSYCMNDHAQLQFKKVLC